MKIKAESRFFSIFCTKYYFKILRLVDKKVCIFLCITGHYLFNTHVYVENYPELALEVP